MHPERDNFKAGLFVLAGVVLALVVVVVLSDLDRLFEPTQTVRVRYTLSDGLQGLKEGAAVTLGDEPVGTIAAIEDVTESTPAGERVVGKLVTLTLPARYRLYSDAVIETQAPPLGSGTRLNIRSVGGDKPYTEGQVLGGALAGSALTESFVRDMGIEDAQRQQIRNIIANVESLTTTLKDELPRIAADIEKILSEAQPLAVDARAAVADLKESVERVKVVLAEVHKRSTPWLDRIDSVTAKTNESVTTVRDLLRDKDPDLRRTVENVRDVSQQVKDKTLAQVTEALDKATTAVENARLASQELRTLAVGQRPVLERAVANAQLTTDQLKLASIELRRSPWRLLYKPSDKEVADDNLYDAARSFALAAGALDSAAQSLRSVSGDGAQNGEQVRQMIEHLEKLFERYEEAEDRFWRALKGRE